MEAFDGGCKPFHCLNLKCSKTETSKASKARSHIRKIIEGMYYLGLRKIVMTHLPMNTMNTAF